MMKINHNDDGDDNGNVDDNMDDDYQEDYDFNLSIFTEWKI